MGQGTKVRLSGFHREGGSPCLHAFSPVCNGFSDSHLSATPADLMAIGIFLIPIRLNMLIMKYRLLNSSDLTRSAPLVLELPVAARSGPVLPVPEWKWKSIPCNKECMPQG